MEWADMDVSYTLERQLSIVQRKDARLPAPAAAFLSLLGKLPSTRFTLD